MSRALFREELRRAITHKKAENSLVNQSSIAKAAGISKSFLSAVLLARRNASQDNIRALAAVLGKTTEDADRWILLNSLDESNLYSLEPDKVREMLEAGDTGMADTINLLKQLLTQSQRQTAILEQIEHNTRR